MIATMMGRSAAPLHPEEWRDRCVRVGVRVRLGVGCRERWRNGVFVMSDARTLVQGLCLAVVLAVVFHAAPAFPEPLREPAAILRVTAQVQTAPSTPAAGCLVRIPDGGILPRPFPNFVVMDSAGNRLRHAVLRHDQSWQLDLLVHPPVSGKDIYIDIKQGDKPEGWTPASGLTPGTFVFFRHGPVSAAEVDRLAELPAGRDVRMATISGPELGGSPSGVRSGFSAYVLAHIILEKSGNYWLAPLGPVRAHVDGVELDPARESDLAAGTGEHMQLQAGIHQVELFHTQQGSRPDPMRLTWRPPDTPSGELSPDENGQPLWAARPIRPKECTRSGVATVKGISGRSGQALPWFDDHAVGYLNFTGTPVILYRFRGETSNGKTRPMVYTFPGNFQTRETGDVYWLLPAHRECTVTATLTNPHGDVTSTFSFETECHGSRKSRIQLETTRAAYRTAFLDMLRAEPENSDAERLWEPAVLDLLARVMDRGKSGEVLALLFTQHWTSVSGRLETRARYRLEDLFIESACASDPSSALRWIEAFRDKDTDTARKLHWELCAAQLESFELADPVSAEVRAESVARQEQHPASSQLARVRLGDLALLRGDLDGATEWYGKARDRWPQRAPAGVDPWKVRAIRETALSETARNALEKNDLDALRETLDRWEREMPQARLTSDLVLVEAQYWMRVGLVRRAQLMLHAYCRTMDLTNDLPEAMRLYLATVFELNQGDAKANAFVDEIKKRFPDHEISERAETLRDILRADQSRRSGRAD